MLPFVHSELPFMHRGIEKYKDFVIFKVYYYIYVGLPFVHRGIEKIKYSVILSTYHGKQIKLSVIVRQLRRGGENDGQ